MGKVLGKLLIGLMLTIGGDIVCAGPYEDAVAAYNGGDYATALRLLRPLAENGNAAAQNNLGVLYLNGQGFPKDYSEAIRWFRLAAAQKNAWAQTNLGAMYRNGNGVPKDYDEAKKWLTLAVAQGNANAQTELGSMYVREEGVPQDYNKAVKLFRLAAAQGNALAQVILGDVYANGRGVPQDYVRSHMWLSISNDNGNANAGKSLPLVISKMTAAQIELAQKLAKRCKETNYKECDETEGNQTVSIATPLPTNPREGNQSPPSAMSVPMQMEGGIYVVPVLINGAIPL